MVLNVQARFQIQIQSMEEIIDKEKSGKKGPVIIKTGSKQYKTDENFTK
jgi:hypothetical protein